MKTVTVYLYAPGSRNDAIRSYQGVPFDSVYYRHGFQFMTKEGLHIITSLEYIIQEEPSVIPQGE
jgi:hypothetical protein